MEITGELDVKAPKEKVAEFFNVPEKVVECVPGIQSYEMKGTEFKSKVKFKVGMISGTFGVEGYIREQKPNEEYIVYLKGKSFGNSFESTSNVKLMEKDAGTTTIQYSAQAKLSGMLAALGKGIIEGVVKDLLKQLFECAEKKITE